MEVSTNAASVNDLLAHYSELELKQLLEMHRVDEIRPMLKLRQRWPKAFKKIIQDNSPEMEPVLEYIEDLDIRRSIFEEMLNISVRFETPLELNASAFAVIMVAPIMQLQEQLARLRQYVRNDDKAAISSFFSDVHLSSYHGIKAFANRGGRPPGSISSSAKSSVKSESRDSSIIESPAKRKCISHTKSQSESDIPRSPIAFANPGASSQLPGTPSQHPGTPFQLLQSSPNKLNRKNNAVKLCKARDRGKCVFTGTPDPEAAHIFPFGVTKNQNFNSLERLLQAFWDEETSKAWREIIKDQSITESPENLLSLNHQLYWWFDNAKMALKPLRKTDTSVTVQFHWLKASNLGSGEKFNGSTIINDTLVKAGLADNQAWGDMPVKRPSGIPLETGQVFELKAKEAKHVPNFALLQLSWDMLRIMAISAAAEPTELWDNEDDGNNGDIASNIWDEDEYEMLQRWAAEIEEEANAEKDAKSLG